MKIEKKVLGDLNAELTFTIEKEDYLPEYETKLKDLQKKSQLKGFRKGKAPISIIKKMYGGNTLQESVSKIISEKINELITGDEYNIIGEPLYLDEQNPPVIDHKNPESYSYRFEIGLEPEFEIKGLEPETSYTKYDIDITDAIVDEEIINIRKKMGSQNSTDTPIVEGDIVYIKSHEMEGNAPKEGGVESTFSVQIDSVTDDYKSKILSSKKGDKLEFDIYNLEKDLPKASVDKYLLKLDAEKLETIGEINNTFGGEISDVIRNEKAEFNQELFDKYFGEGEVKSEEEAKGKIKEYLKEYFNEESKNFLSREVMEGVMEKNKVDLPVDFIKKMINKEKEMPQEQFDSVCNELRWSIIKKRLVKKHEINVEEKEILDYFVKAVRSYSPYMDEATLKNTVFSLMKNREQLNKAVDVLSTGKLFDKIQETLKTDIKSIDKEAFYAKVKAVSQKSQ